MTIKDEQYFTLVYSLLSYDLVTLVLLEQKSVEFCC